MALAAASAVAVEDIPVIDVQALRSGEPGAARSVADAMLTAAEHLGFFYIRGHGVSSSVLANADAEARAFFSEPQEIKQAIAINHRHRGYLRVGEATMHGAKAPDLKESFVYGLEVAEDDPLIAPDNPFLGPNQWPADRPAFRDAMRTYFAETQAIGRDLMRAFAVAMDLEENTFVARFERPISRGAAVYYPPQAADESMRFGVGPHTDFGCLTLVHQDPVGGLEVRNREGAWVQATPVEGSFVVNVGDLLARWTNDRFASTPHRVVNRSGRERLSLAVFVDPDFETVIDPADVLRDGEQPRYQPTRCGDYVLGRYAGAFAYRQS